MALDLSRIRSKLNELNKKPANDIIWKPTPGSDNLIRIVPLASDPNYPFQELFFHYLGNKTYLSPRSYGDLDPIADFSDKLVGEGGLSKDEFKAAKKFSPQVRTYAPIVVRGKESDGVKFWAFGKTVFTAITTIMDDPDYGDITDVEKGHDIKVTFTEAKDSDTGFAKTEIMPKPKPCVLTADATLLKRLLSEQPVLMDSYKKFTYAELEKVLADYLRVVTDDPFDPSVGTVVEAAPKAAKAKTNTVEASDEEWAAPSAPTATAPKTAEPSGNSETLDEEFDAMFNN